MPKKRTTRKKSVDKRRAKPRKKIASKQSRKKKLSLKRNRVTVQSVDTVPFPSEERRDHSDGQSGDLQGLSNPPIANSESVQELLEEGNALEAEAIQGVENALDADQGEIRTHEVPEDDVPQEYLKKDQ
jgi:hypothetical protein